MKARYDENKNLLTIFTENNETGEVRNVVTINCILENPLQDDSVPQIIPLYKNKKMVYHTTDSSMYVSDGTGQRIHSDDLPLKDNQRTVFEFNNNRSESLLASYEVDTQTHMRTYMRVVRESYAPAEEIKMISERINNGIACLISRKEEQSIIHFDAKGIVIGGTHVTSDGKKTVLAPNEAFDVYYAARECFSLRKDMQLLPIHGLVRKEAKLAGRLDTDTSLSDILDRRNEEVTAHMPKKTSKVKSVLSWLLAVASVTGAAIYSRVSKRRAEAHSKISKIVQRTDVSRNMTKSSSENTL